jgi:RNA polymerase sigma factor (sigma-70 family)
MSSHEELFATHLAFADSIAAGYANTPAATPDDLRAIAREALHRASLKYDPGKGPFEPYAGRAIRNALNDLHAKHAKVAKHEIVIETQQDASTQASFIDQAADHHQDVAMIVSRVESREVLEELLAALSPRSRMILGCVAQGHSYVEMGERLGITKQAAHKAAAAAMDDLREQLEARGFKGLDSQGLLKSDSLRNLSSSAG